MGAPLRFYEVVTLLPCDALPERLWGASGVVVGRADCGEAGWEYCVLVQADGNASWQLHEAALSAWGETLSREHVYGEGAVRVPAAPRAPEEEPSLVGGNVRGQRGATPVQRGASRRAAVANEP